MTMTPLIDGLKRGAKLALFMLVGAAIGTIVDLAAFFAPHATTNTLGIVQAECQLIDALIGAGAGLLLYLLMPVWRPPFAALNARLQADSWTGPKTPAE